VPLPALILVGVICILLSLINLGSSTGFNIILSLSTIAGNVSYMPPLVLLTIRQLTGRHPKYGPFRLGRWSVPVKLATMAYLVYVTVFVAFPPERPVTSENTNYAAPILIGFIAIAMVDWVFRGRNKFEVPTAALEHGWDES
jgi:amino acid transporter